MSRKINVKPPAVCKRFEVNEKDLLKIDATTLVRMAFLLHLVRKFETVLLDFVREDLVYGPVHSSIGQEAIAAASLQTCGKGDYSRAGGD